MFGIYLVTKMLLRAGAKGAITGIQTGKDEEKETHRLYRDEVVGNFLILVYEPLPEFKDKWAADWIVEDLDRFDQPVDPGVRAYGYADTAQEAYEHALAWAQANS